MSRANDHFCESIAFIVVVGLALLLRVDVTPTAG
jgi:hypothetical protein